MSEVLARVFRKPVYIFLALGCGLLFFLFAIWLPNISLVFDIARVAGVLAALSFLFNLAGSLATNFTLFSLATTIFISLLLGVEISLLFFYWKRAKMPVGSGSSRIIGAGLGGVIAGLLGVGCASCGLFIVSALFGTLGAGTIASFLPFGGMEFGLLGVILLLVTIVMTTKKISDPLICEQ